MMSDRRQGATPRLTVGPDQVMALAAFLLVVLLLAASLPLAAVTQAVSVPAGPRPAGSGAVQVDETPTVTPTVTATITPTVTSTVTRLLPPPATPTITDTVTPTASATPTPSATPTSTASPTATPTIQAFAYLPFILKGWPPPTPTPTPTVITYTYLPLVIREWPRPTPTPTNTPLPISLGDPRFSYGIQAHMLYDDRDLMADIIKDMGFGWVKQQVLWRDVEPSKGVYDLDQLDLLDQWWTPPTPRASGCCSACCARLTGRCLATGCPYRCPAADCPPANLRRLRRLHGDAGRPVQGPGHGLRDLERAEPERASGGPHQRLPVRGAC